MATIPSEGKIILLEIYCIKESLFSSVARILSESTITIDYEDIYKKKFKQTEKLVFFDGFEVFCNNEE